MKTSERMDLLDRLITDSVDLGIGHQVAEEERAVGGRVRLNGRELVNFASCSYLGLDLDPRLIEGAVEAVRAHGVETSCSRAYLSSPLYQEFESLAQEIFDAHVVVCATTTLGHLAALPVLVTEEDALVMDHQVHTSVQVASQFVKGSGAHLEVIRHNDLAQLEERVIELSKSHRVVWYLADGVYSMFGDLSPNRELVEMLDRNPQMRIYIDDAHGMSWAGPRGSGTVMAEVDLHPRMVLTTGMAKGFGPGGGLIVLPDAEQKRRIRTCGPTLIFGGPLQPPILGAAIASARIHLSPEIEELQQDLQDRMTYCNQLLEEARVPVVSSPETPVGFIGMGPVAACQAMCRSLLAEGLFTNPAQFPAAPMRRGGTRFLLTRHHSQEDIERLVTGLSRHWESAVRAGGATPEEVWGAFGLEMPESRRSPRPELGSGLVLERADTIDKFNEKEWDSMAAHRGCMAASGLALFERVFGAAAEETQRWTFRYYVVRDKEGAPVLATFFTKSLWKADMLAPAAVSEQIERERAKDPLHLTQQVFSQGCLLSEGDHLWLREPVDSPTSREAISILLEAVRADAQLLGCDVRVLRDVPRAQQTLVELFEDDGFLRMPAPESLVLDDVLASEQDLFDSLPRRHRYHHRHHVIPFNDRYETEVLGLQAQPLDPEDGRRIHELYANVKKRNLGLNTFDLPECFFREMVASEGWEIVLLRDADDEDRRIVGFFASFHGQPDYVPLVAGLDYEWVEKAGLYRQLLRHIVSRARARGHRRVLFGMGATLEKRRMGARLEPALIMMEADDAYAFDAVAHIAADAG